MFAAIFHYVGGFLKYLGALAVVIVSISLSFAMFGSITPPDMPWFPWASLGLTDIGFLIWLIVFRTMALREEHGQIQPEKLQVFYRHKSVAFIMVWICLFAVLFTDAMELGKMFHIVPLFAGMYYYAFIGLLLAHMLALAVDEFISEDAKSKRLYGTPPQQTQYSVTEKRTQPKEERSLEQRATRQLPPASPGPGVLSRLKSGIAGMFASAPVPPLPPIPQRTQEEEDEWLAEIELKRERDMAEEKQRKEAAKQRVLVRQSQQLAPETPVQQPEPVDRKAEAEQQSKNQ